MPLLRTLHLRLRALLAKRQLDADMDEEMRSHIEMQTQENIEAGMTPREARYAAIRQFGHLDGIKELARDERGTAWIEGLAADLRHAARLLRKHPLSNGVIILTVALLVGAVSVLYASMNEERARLMPFPKPDRLARLWRVGEGGVAPGFPAALFHEYRNRLESFETLGALERTSMTLTGEGDPLRCAAIRVSSGLLRLAGIPPLSGRLFDETDEEPGADSAVIISSRLWRTRFEADPAVIGRDIQLDGRNFTVIGVLPDSMEVTHLAVGGDIWLPDAFAPHPRGNLEAALGGVVVIGRLKPGRTPAQAQAELDVAAPRVEQEHAPGFAGRSFHPGTFKGARLAPLDKPLERAGSRDPAIVWIFTGMLVACVGGVACFNVANLLLARAAGRSQEIAIRLSLGATRTRVARQVLAETLFVTLLGGAAGLLVSFWICHLLRFQRVDPHLDWLLYGTALAGVVVLGALAGLLPALRTARIDLTETLKSGSQSGGRRRHRLRNFLVASEVAMASILCVAAGLIMRGSAGVLLGDPGFDPERLLAISVSFDPQTVDRPAYVDRALRALREMPGVEAAAASADRQGLLEWIPRVPIAIVATEGTEEPTANVSTWRAGHEYAGMIGMTLLRGNDLSPDPAAAAGQAVVNESFARRFFPGTNPIGRQLRTSWQSRETPWSELKLNWHPTPLTIVGVARDRHPSTSGGSVGPEVILGIEHETGMGGAHFLVRTSPEAKVMTKPVRDVFARLDSGQPVSPPALVSDLMTENRRQWKAVMLLMGGLAGFGLLIALTGLYGVVAVSVTERTRELGIRMALGAGRWDALKLVLWQGGRLMLLGCIPGILAGWLVVTNLPEGDVPRFDLATGLAVALLVGLVGLIACLLPARRAATINPMEALREE